VAVKLEANLKVQYNTQPRSNRNSSHPEAYG